MTRTPEELFRQAALAEGAESVSAGARVEHERIAEKAGRCFVDLSDIPEASRATVVAQIKELLDRARAESSPQDLRPTPDAPRVSG